MQQDYDECKCNHLRFRHYHAKDGVHYQGECANCDCKHFNQLKLFDNTVGWSSHGIHLSSKVERMIEAFIRENADINQLELIGIIHGGVAAAFHSVAIKRRLCEHKNVPEDDNLCEECGSYV